MRKQIIALFFIFISIVAHTQNKNVGRFFNSYEDYKTNKPVDGQNIVKWSFRSVEIKTGGTTDKVKVSSLPYSWFVNETGMLMRVYKKDLYYVVVDGPLCFYVKASEGTASCDDKGCYVGNRLSDTWPREFYSETPNGEIKKLKDNMLNTYLEKYGLKDQYKNDPAFKREMKDCVTCWQAKKTDKKVKYMMLINEKMK